MPLSTDPVLRARQLENLKREPGEPPANAFAEGNAARVVHGLRTVNPPAIVKDAIVGEITAALADTVPLRDADDQAPMADRYAIELAAIALVRVRKGHAYLELHGDTDDAGRLRPEFEMLGRAVADAGRALDRIGCSPLARARLGLDVARAQQAGRSALSDHIAAHYSAPVADVQELDS